MAVRIYGGSDPGTDIWLYHFARRTLSRFITKLNDAETPVWTPDGKRVAYAVTGINPARQVVWNSPTALLVTKFLWAVSVISISEDGRQRATRLSRWPRTPAISGCCR